MNEEIMQAAYTWSRALCECAGENEEYAEEFWKRLCSFPGVLSEFVYYMLNQSFACEYKINDVSIVDIMVWQIDYFKAGMDMGRAERNNPDRMLLTAFATMLEMENNPDEIIGRMKSDTGTDYPGKF